jgi:NADH-quinone oxidoreductase subunit H
MIIIQFLAIIVPILLSVAILTLAERKIMAAIQIRRGPNVIGYGLLQPLADGLKLLIKELIIPLKGNKYLFLFSPILFLSLSFASWSVIPFDVYSVASPDLAILVFLAFSSLSVYGILLGGWSSNSRYAFLGAVRSASQMISYELVLGLLVMLTVINTGSYNFVDVIKAQSFIANVFILLPMFFVYLVAILAETNRTPFDLPEAEAELVAGYSVEYSSAPFAFYFIAEYCNLIIWSHITTILFWGGWQSFWFLPILPPNICFMIKSFIILFFFCWARATFPRYRFDQLLNLTWRYYLPITLAFVLFIFILYRYSCGFSENIISCVSCVEPELPPHNPASGLDEAHKTKLRIILDDPEKRELFYACLQESDRLFVAQNAGISESATDPEGSSIRGKRQLGLYVLIIVVVVGVLWFMPFGMAVNPFSSMIRVAGHIITDGSYEGLVNAAVMNPMVSKTLWYTIDAVSAM